MILPERAATVTSDAPPWGSARPSVRQPGRAPIILATVGTMSIVRATESSVTPRRWPGALMNSGTPARSSTVLSPTVRRDCPGR